MNYYEVRQQERALERQELANIKSALHGVSLRTQLLDEPADVVREVQQESKLARGINPATMRKYGLDPRNSEHRRAWANRNKGPGW